MRAPNVVVPVGLLVAMGSLTASSGCNHMERRYVTPEGASVYAMTFAPDTPPLFMGREENLYQLETPIELPIRPPTAAEESALAGAPWVSRGDYETEITFTVTNLDMENVRVVGVTLNGINPMFEYVPGFSVEQGNATPDFAQWERTYALEPGESRTITVREEEIDEIAVDLASATSSPECELLANQIVYFMNQSGIDPRSTACVPPVIPGLVGFKLGLRSTAAEPPPVAIEASVEMRDVRDRIASPGQPVWEPPMPTPFTPPPPPEE
ncbi:MAG: hypothetical protein U0353_09800 [Sandaracinus sp.]|jgi:hypothetical protein